MSSYLVQQLADIRAQIADLEEGRVTHRAAQVTTVDPATSTFAAALPDGQELTGLEAPSQLLPRAGQWVRLRLQGATPVYEPAGISENAITDRELAPGSVTVEQMAADLIASLTGAIIERQATQPDPPEPGRQAYWWDSSDSNRLRQYNQATGDWDLVLFGNGAIDPNSLIASDVLVSGTVSAELLEAVVVLVSTVIAGDPNGYHARLDPDGFRAMRPGPDGGLIEATRLGGPGDDVLSITDAAGVPVIYGDNEGKLTAAALYTEQLFHGGREVLSLLDDLPRGIVQRAIFEGLSARTTTELGVLELGAILQPGRLYEVRTSALRMMNDTPSFEAVARIRWVSGGAATTVSSPLFMEGFVRIDSTSGEMVTLQRTIVDEVTTPDTPYRFLLSIAKIGGTGDCYLYGDSKYPIEVLIEDKGRWRPQGGVLSTGSGGAGSVPQPTQNYEKAYTASWTRTIRGDGTVRADTTDAVQGQAPGDTFNGNQGAMIGFPDWSADIVGATINRVTLFMYANHFYSDSGGPAWIGYHGYVSPVSVIDGAQNQTTASFPKVGPGEAKDLTAWAGLIANGTIRGIILGRPPAGAENYGRFAGAGTAHPPVLVINYTR